MLQNISKILLSLLIVTNTYAGIDTAQLTTRFSSWGVNPSLSASINLLPVWKKFEMKKQIKVAVVDTGIDQNHSFLKSNHYNAFDFSKKTTKIGIAKDEHGHGTHVSGIVKSVFPQVQIITLKYYNPTASGLESLDATLKALKHAVDLNVDVINYSGGGPEASMKELRILKEAERKGILVVCAAGNEGQNIDDKKHAFYPASYGLKNIISVTAYDRNLKTLNSSNYGVNSVDISAPGFRIKSSLPHNRAGYLTGTSQATAFVTGVAALIKSNYPTLNMFEIKKIILKGSKKEAIFAKINGNSSRLDATLAFEMAKEIVNERAQNRKLAYKSGPNYKKAN